MGCELTESVKVIFSCGEERNVVKSVPLCNNFPGQPCPSNDSRKLDSWELELVLQTALAPAAEPKMCSHLPEQGIIQRHTKQSLQH